MKNNKSRIITVSMLLIGVLFLSAGILRGENIIIFEKAINICLECIGIG